LPLWQAGHLPQARKPVAVNLALREFFGSLRPAPPAAVSEAPKRAKPRAPDRKRVLYVSSPIGLSATPAVPHTPPPAFDADHGAVWH